MAAPALDFWFEFSSTYSYPAAMRIGALAAEAGVEVRLRPFLLGPIFQAHGWNTSPFILYPAKGRQDVARPRAHLRRAVAAVSAAGALSAIGASAARVALVGLPHPLAEAAWTEDFCHAVYRAEFAEGRRIDQLETIRDILSELKVDPKKRWRRRKQTK